MSFIVTSFIVARIEIGFSSVIKSPVPQFYPTENYQQRRSILILNMSRIIYEGDTINFSIEKTAIHPARLLSDIITFNETDNVHKSFTVKYYLNTLMYWIQKNAAR